MQFHNLRSSQVAARRFISIHVLIPGKWTVKRGHLLVERIKDDIRYRLSNVTVFAHIEPVEDPSSLQDLELDRLRIILMVFLTMIIEIFIGEDIPHQ